MKNTFIKLIAGLSSILMILSSVLVMASATEPATISAEQIDSVNPGQIVTIPIKISSNPGIMGFSISVKYDKSILTPISVSSGTILTGLFDDSIETSEAGTFDVVWSGTENCTQNGILFNMTFTVNGSATGTTKIDLSYSQADTFNENWQDVVLNCEGVNLAIGNQQVTEMTLTVGSVNTLANKAVIVPISASGNNLTKCFNITITYDSNVLIPKAISNGNYTVVSSNAPDADGMLNIELSSDDPQSGVAASIEFFVKSEAEGNYILNASSTSAKCILGTVSVSTPDKTSYILADNVETLRGETITVPIKISSNLGVMGYRLSFAYDESVLTPVGAVVGEGFLGNFDDSIGIKTNTFDIVWSNSSNITINGNIAILTFKINDTASFGETKVAISFTQTDTFDEEWSDVNFICSDFLVDVKNVVINNAKESIKVGETLQLTASTGTSGDVSWSSSDESVAKVDSTGKVTAVGSGLVTITASNENGSESITIQIVKSYICPDCGNEILGEDTIVEHITAEARMKATVKIKNNNGSKTINYGETLKLTAIVTDLPENIRIVWYVSGEERGEGETYSISLQSGSVEVSVKLVDENDIVLLDSSGNEISDSEIITVKTGFFQKLISFFKNLFRISRIVIQSI